MGDMDKTLLSKRHVGDGVSMATVCEEYVCRLQIWEISHLHVTTQGFRDILSVDTKWLSYEAGCNV